MVTVSSASFFRMPGGSLVIVCSGSFPRRALPLVARVGDVDVEGISVSPDGRQFMGVLTKWPRSGDEVVVRFLPEPAMRSGLRFPAEAVRVA